MALIFTESLEIALPREGVMELISDPDLMPQWLRGVVSHEPLNGRHGELGTRSRVVMRSGAQEMEAVETVTRREPAEPSLLAPTEAAVYERELVADGMRSLTSDRFTAIGPERTLWESRSEYRFDGRVMALLAPLMRRSFRKQTRRHVLDFQVFAERGVDVRDTD